MENYVKIDPEIESLCEEKAVFEKLQTDKWDRIFAVLYLFVGWSLWKVFDFTYLPYPGHANHIFQFKVAGFTLLYLSVLWSYSLIKGLKVTKEKLFWTGILLCIGISYGFYTIIPITQFFFWFVAGAYGTLAIMDGLLLKKRTSGWVVLDLWHGLCSLPILNFFCQIRAGLQIFSWKSEKKEGRKILLGIGCSLPVLAVILPTLAHADSEFEKLIDRAVSWVHLEGGALANLLSLFMALLFGGLLYGAAYGSIYRRHIDETMCEEWKEESGEDFHILPDTSVFTFATVISLVYVIFMLVQGKYLFSACLGILPEHLTYAQYARQGFFELCGVAALNLGLLLLMNSCSRTIRKENPRLRLLNVIFSLLTLLLLITAMSRMGMYIFAYGFTVKRILTSVFMIWLFGVFSMIVVLQKKDFPIVRYAVFSGAALFAGICVLPMEALL